MVRLGAFGGFGMRSPAGGPNGLRAMGAGGWFRALRWGGALLAASSLTLAIAAPASAKAPKPKKPGPPLALKAVPENNGATFSWTAPTSDGGSPITGYTVKVHNSTCSTGGATTCAITGLVNGHNYSAKVSATNTVGTGMPSHAVPFVAGQSPNCANLVPGANLRYCHLGNEDLNGYDLAGADLSGAILRDTTFNGTDLDNAIFDEASGTAKLDSADFSGAQMVGSQFVEMFLEDDGFSDANLTDASFESSVIVTSNFDGATMTGADLSGVSWQSVGCPDGTQSNDDGNTCINNLG